MHFVWRAFFTLASASALQLHAQPLYRPPTRYSTVRLAASWEEVDGGCQLLRPEGKPRALIHFLGGVFVSPEPQVAYASLLESLAARGYVVVATPFAVDFDYRKPADEVYAKFGAAKVALGEYSSLPQLAMGHSLGALLQVLLGCWYPEYADACAGAALLSFNNKPVKEAIPAFEELFVPALAPIEPVTRDPVFGVEGSLFTQLKDLRRTGFSLAREVARLNPLNAPATLREPLESAIDNAEAIASLGDQLPEVFASVSRGTSEFRPTPVEVRAMLGEYSQRQPLLVSFSVDSLDETDDLEQGIPVAIDAKRTRLTGTHLTPLAILGRDELLQTVSEYFEVAIERQATSAATSTAAGAEAEAEEVKEAEEVEEAEEAKEAKEADEDVEGAQMVATQPVEPMDASTDDAMTQEEQVGAAESDAVAEVQALPVEDEAIDARGGESGEKA